MSGRSGVFWEIEMAVGVFVGVVGVTCVIGVVVVVEIRPVVIVENVEK